MGTIDLHTTPLHPHFGVEIHDVDIRDITANSGYAEIRSAFEQHSLLLFRSQTLGDQAHIKFSQLFGPIENREKGSWGVVPNEIAPLSNLSTNGSLIDQSDLRLLHLQSNQLWHTDSTFLPVPALANILVARVLPSSGGETELASTRAAWGDLPEQLKSKARNAVLKHRYAHSRAKINPELAKQELYTMWEDQRWRAIWPNPSSGEEALYIASHAFEVEGMEVEAGQAFIQQLIDWATQEQYVYSHAWKSGDVLVWDERATLHRGRAWPYQEERTLTSLCVTARENDGLELVRPAAN